MNIPRTIAAVAGLALLAGCVGTTPPRLYTLDRTPSGAVKPNANIEVERLHPLDALGGGGIVIRRGAHELDTYPLDHWASNIGELASQKLAAEFGDASADRPTVSISGDLIAFEQVDSDDGGALARVAMALEVRKKGDSRYAAPLLAKTYQADVPVADALSPANVVAALSRGVETIAQEIAADVSGLDLSTETAAPRRELLHTLDMTPSGKATAAFNIDVTSLRRSEALARNNILVRPNATTIDYYADDRWAASVSTLAAEKLEAEFGAPQAGRDTVQLTGALLAFEREDTPNGAVGHVKLDATLQGTQQGGARPVLWKVYEASAPVEGVAASGVAAALSRALEEIAAAIAVDAGRIPPVAQAPSAPPVHLYSLDMTPSGKAPCNYNVIVERFSPHDSLTRADIVIVRGETLVDRYPNDRWASGLAELVPEKLTAEFGRPVDGRATVNVIGTISAFEQVERAGQPPAALARVNITARWADVPAGAPALRRVYEATVPLEGDGAPATVKALSRAVEQIAASAAADINALPPPTAP